MREVITGFGGQLPRVTSYGLPTNMAARATNAKLVSGEVRGIHSLSTVHDFSDIAITNAFRIPFSPADLWLGFEDPDAVVVRSPLVNDGFKRYYIHEPGLPVRYNTEARIVAGDPAFLLGVPQPGSACAIASIVGGAVPVATRVYTYTFVSAYGEEGPPAAPSAEGTGNDDATWNLDTISAAVPDASERNITLKNIYRTVTAASGNADFYFVAQIPIADTTYADTKTDLEVASLGIVLESTFWFPPEADMEGMTSFPGGVLLGWRDSTVFMTVPYRPHAWNPLYNVSAEFPVVGIGVTGTTAVLATQGKPAAITMTAPENAALQKIEAAEPCLSRGSVVGTPEGVYYASQNGLMFFGTSGFANATQGMITKEEWLAQFAPTTLRACRYQTDYIGLTQPGVGYVISGADQQQGLIELSDLLGASNIQNDIWSGEVYLIANGQVFKWDDATTTEVAWRWATKRFFFPYEINIGAIRLGTQQRYYSLLAVKPDADSLFVATPDAVAGMGAPANTIPALPGWAIFVLRVYRDGGLVLVRYVTDADTIRLPADTKSQDWQFEIWGRYPMAKLEFAETAKELAEV